MVNHWIIVAKRPDGYLKTIRRVIDSRVWDFVSSRDSSTPITPSYAHELCENDKVLFYISDKDQEGTLLFSYKAFIAHAILASMFEYEGKINGERKEKFVRLRDINHFNPPIKINGVCKNFKICGGPKTIVPIMMEKYDKVLKLSASKKARRL